MQAVSSEVAKQGFQTITSKGTGRVQWRTQYMGSRYGGDQPQAFLVEMSPGGSFPRMYHAVNQFQIFVSGSGFLGRGALPLVTLHYADEYTPFGPTNSGACGLSFFTLRTRATPGPVYAHDPAYNERMQPSRKRYLLAQSIELSTAPAMQYRSEIALDSLDEINGGDGLAAYMVRMGAGMRTTGPDPKAAGGQYCMVINGELELQGTCYPKWSLVYLAPHDAPLQLCAGECGVEALILSFPVAAS